MTEELATVSTVEAAVLLGCHRSTVTRMIQDGSLRAHRLTLAKQSPLRITMASVDELLAQRIVHPDDSN